MDEPVGPVPEKETMVHRDPGALNLCQKPHRATGLGDCACELGGARGQARTVIFFKQAVGEMDRARLVEGRPGGVGGQDVVARGGGGEGLAEHYPALVARETVLEDLGRALEGAVHGVLDRRREGRWHGGHGKSEPTQFLAWPVQ